MTESDEKGLYSPAADEQLDRLATGPDAALYEAVLSAIDRILDYPEIERGRSPGLRDAAGEPILSTVVMFEADPRWFVFWKLIPQGPVILGIAALPSAAL